MAVRKLVLFPDRNLSQSCETVTEFGPALGKLLEDLWDTLTAGPGVGLAAPQIGVNKRVSVINVHRRKGSGSSTHHGTILINPVLLAGSGLQIPREGCLSIPDLLANVRRYEKVTVRSLDVRGNERIFRSEGFEALAFQHEIDHLDGKLFIDRVANLRTDIFRRKTY